MPLSHDTILLETVRTRRMRLQSAFLHGGLAQRRVVDDNVRRVLGSLVAAAVLCAGCVGFALVTSLIPARGGGPAVGRPPAISPSGHPAAPSGADRP
ncbi:MAG TPA: hypothetical protein VI357_19785 [Mycobacteriales bacterium]